MGESLESEEGGLFYIRIKVHEAFAKGRSEYGEGADGLEVGGDEDVVSGSGGHRVGGAQRDVRAQRRRRAHAPAPPSAASSLPALPLSTFPPDHIHLASLPLQLRW